MIVTQGFNVQLSRGTFGGPFGEEPPPGSTFVRVQITGDEETVAKIQDLLRRVGPLDEALKKLWSES